MDYILNNNKITAEIQYNGKHRGLSMSCLFLLSLWLLQLAEILLDPFIMLDLIHVALALKFDYISKSERMI